MILGWLPQRYALSAGGPYFLLADPGCRQPAPQQSAPGTAQSQSAQKRLFTLEGKIAGGRSFLDHYDNGPEFRCLQADTIAFSLSGTVTFNRSAKAEVGRVEYVQTQFQGAFESTLSITDLDSNGNGLATKTYNYSGALSQNSAGVEGLGIKNRPIDTPAPCWIGNRSQGGKAFTGRWSPVSDVNVELAAN